jgi:hypothetical protein
MIREFLAVYRLYRKAHGPRYSLLTAWRIAVHKLPF